MSDIQLISNAELKASFGEISEGITNRGHSEVVRCNFADPSGWELVFQRLLSVFVPIFERWFFSRDFQGDINAKYIKATLEQFPTCCSRLGIIVTK